MPIGFLNGSEVVPSNQIYILPNAGLYEFGILSSLMHNAWMRTVAGRLESWYRYSPNVYNLFVWIDEIDVKDKAAIENCVKAVSAVRDEYAEQTLANLHNPVLMPMELRKVHKALDKAVDRAYQHAFDYPGKFVDEAERAAFLFECYDQI